VQAFTRRKPVRAPLPEHLPRERVVIPGLTACPCCGGRLSKLGETITESLESVPRQWKVVQTVREKFTCRSCETISQPPAPFYPIARGRAGPKLLALILTRHHQKCARAEFWLFSIRRVEVKRRPIRNIVVGRPVKRGTDLAVLRQACSQMPRPKPPLPATVLCGSGRGLISERGRGSCTATNMCLRTRRVGRVIPCRGW
jgi:hypothetical protein